MEITIKSDEELALFLDVLADEITSAHNNYKLNKDLSESVSSNAEVFNEANTFWHLTTKALLDSALLQLCRIYDQHSSTLNLVNLLDTIKVNEARFFKDKFKERLVGNAFVESLADVNRLPSADEIDVDRKFTNRENEVVTKLMLWRDNLIAHRAAKVAFGKRKIIDDNPLSYQDIENLISNALRLYNKYSSLFRASTQSPNMVGNEDYKSVLKFMKMGIQKYKEDRS